MAVRASIETTVDMELWLSEQPYETVLLVALRSAFRALSWVVGGLSQEEFEPPEHRETIVLPLLRGAAMAWYALEGDSRVLIHYLMSIHASFAAAAARSSVIHAA